MPAPKFWKRVPAQSDEEGIVAREAMGLDGWGLTVMLTSSAAVQPFAARAIRYTAITAAGVVLVSASVMFPEPMAVSGEIPATLARDHVYVVAEEIGRASCRERV